MKFRDLTDRQKSVLAFIAEYQRQNAIAPTVREIARHLGLSSPGGIHRILTVLKERGYLQADALKKRSWRVQLGGLTVGGIAVIGDIAAGDPIEAMEHVQEELDISPSVFGCESCFGLRVRGDSMIDAHIVDGDLAIIRRQRTVVNGAIAAVLVEDLITEATLKIVHRTATTLTLKPANEAYKPMVFEGNHRKRVAIVGKLVGVVRRQ